MAFQQFKFPDVLDELGLTWEETDLLGPVPPVPVDPEFLDRLAEGIALGSAIGTEKAKSEFIIAPVLLQLRWTLGIKFGLFSGVELNADANLGLNGICDFILTRSPTQHYVRTPIVAVAEAKNDNPRTGLGQCISAMVAARMLNRADPAGPATIYGVVTTGSLWRFLRLTDSALVMDETEYHVDNLGKIMAVLGHMVRTA